MARAGVGRTAGCLLAVTVLLLGHATHQVTGQGLLGFTEKIFGANRRCVANQLREFDDILKAAEDLDGKGGGSKGRGAPPRYAAAKQQAKPRVQARKTAAGASQVVEDCAEATSSDFYLDAVFHLATMPEKHIVPLPRVRNQGECDSCVSMAMAGLVEAAVANSIGQAPRDVPKLDARFLHYCKLDGLRGCKRGMSLTVAISGLTVEQDGKPPELSTCPQVKDVYDTRAAAKECGQALDQCKRDLGSPGFTCYSKDLNSIQEMQAEIAAGWPVISGMQLINKTQFEQFFKDNPKGVYNVTSSCKIPKACEPHAVLVVGYDNTANVWTLLNSWNTSFGDQGLFRLAYGTAELGLPSQTFGLHCQPTSEEALKQVQQRRLQLKPLLKEPNCYNYTVDTNRTPTLSSIAWQLEVRPGRLVADNPSVFRIYSKTITHNVTDTAAAASGQSECSSDVTCQSRSSLLCRSAVTLDPLTKDTCNVTWQLPDLTVPLNGTTLKVCKGQFDEQSDERTRFFQENNVVVVVCPPGTWPSADGAWCEECSRGSKLPGCLSSRSG